MPPSSPIVHEFGTEYDTPTRKAVRSDRFDHALTYQAIANTRQIPKTSVIRICDDTSSRRSIHNPKKEEKRGKDTKVSPKDVRQMELILQEDGFCTRALTWKQLGYEAGLDVSWRTIQRHMGTIDYHKCIACRKGWCNEQTKKRRVEYAEYWIQRYSKPEDWYSIRFSDECHYGFGPQGKLRIIRKPGERYCQDCIQEGDPRGEAQVKDQKRQHTWAAAGYGFKSDLVYYTVQGNTNGKMSHKVYIDSILEPVVKPWIQAVRAGNIEPFVLEEDGDSGHGSGRTQNPVRRWKEEKGLKYYFNCASSPDLAPIENCWQAPKQHLRKIPHWDDETTRAIINEGWDQVTIPFIGLVVRRGCKKVGRGSRFSIC